MIKISRQKRFSARIEVDIASKCCESASNYADKALKTLDSIDLLQFELLKLRYQFGIQINLSHFFLVWIQVD